MFFYCWFGRHFEKNIFPFPFTPAKLLSSDQMISNGAANASFLLIICDDIVLVSVSSFCSVAWIHVHTSCCAPPSNSIPLLCFWSQEGISTQKKNWTLCSVDAHTLMKRNETVLVKILANVCANFTTIVGTHFRFNFVRYFPYTEVKNF
jgi:hypothetical protein